MLFVAFQLPDVFAKFRVVLARFFVERHLMVFSKPSFKFRSRKTYVGFGFAGRCDLGLVNVPLERQFSSKGHSLGDFLFMS